MKLYFLRPPFAPRNTLRGHFLFLSAFQDDIIYFMSGRGKNTLTHRLMLTYALIALIPVIILVSVTSLALQKQQIDMIIQASNAELDETEARIENMIESVARLETAYQMRTDLAIMLSSPDTNWNDFDVITKYINEITEIQRELFLVSQVADMRVYVYNESIPERWPIILHQSRMTADAPLDGWSLSQKNVPLGISDSEADDVALHTLELSYYGRSYALLQTSLNFETFLSELYGLGEYGEQNDYVFQLSESGNTRVLPSAYQDEGHDSISPEALDKALSAITGELDNGIRRGEVSFFCGIRIIHVLYFYEEGPSLLFMKVCPTEDINRTYVLYLFGSLFFVFLIMAVIMFFVVYSTKKQTKTLIAIMAAMGEVAKGNFDVYLPDSDIRAGDVNDAKNALLSLTDQLRNTLQAMKNQEEMLADTQIRAMQNQINVHFLINTVESIKMQAMMNGDDSVEHSLELLGDLFRYTLRWKERFVLLKDELSYISSYIELMNFRNEYRVEYENLIDLKWEVLKVPKMILQPIIENAFKYSFSVAGKNGNIVLESEEKEDRVLIFVINDGVPLTEKKKEEVLEYLKNENPERNSRSGSIGLKNIQQRLFMFYGDDYKIDIMETEGRTCVSIPIRKEVGHYENSDS